MDRWKVTSFSHAALSPAMRTAPLPWTATALRFFDPITPPTPPAEWDTELTTMAMGARFSPAWPMAATVQSAPISWLISRVVRRMPEPHRGVASRISTRASRIMIQTGFSARPSTIRAS